MRADSFLDDRAALGRPLSVAVEVVARASRMCRGLLAGGRSSRLELAALVSISFFVLEARAIGQTSPAGQSSLGDRLEPGLQGQTIPDDLKTDTLQQPYSKGVRLIGHTDLWNRGSNLQMAWIDSCAYVVPRQNSI
jgi:hypothetical protein